MTSIRLILWETLIFWITGRHHKAVHLTGCGSFCRVYTFGGRTTDANIITYLNPDNALSGFKPIILIIVAGKVEDGIWPLPKFRFLVDWGDQQNGMSFQEISGLDKVKQVIQYRDQNSADNYKIKMPGIVNYSSVTMKRGIFVNDDSFRKWNDQVKKNTIKKQTVTIKMLNEKGNPTVAWTLEKAWPTKISSTDIRSDGNAVAIDSMEVAYELLNISWLN